MVAGWLAGLFVCHGTNSDIRNTPSTVLYRCMSSVYLCTLLALRHPNSDHPFSYILWEMTPICFKIACTVVLSVVLILLP